MDKLLIYAQYYTLNIYIQHMKKSDFKFYNILKCEKGYFTKSETYHEITRFQIGGGNGRKMTQFQLYSIFKYEGGRE